MSDKIQGLHEAIPQPDPARCDGSGSGCDGIRIASPGVNRIAAERERQITKEGWTPEHDDEHDGGELALVAALYATPTPLFEQCSTFGDGVLFRDPWPDSWSAHWDKRARTAFGKLRTPSRKDRIRALEKAGALIAAEIDRLLRATETR